MHITEQQYHPEHLQGCIAQANKLIAAACLSEYKKAQVSKTGKRYKKTQSYIVPEWCKELQAIIQTENEHDIKAAMHAIRIRAWSAVIA